MRQQTEIQRIVKNNISHGNGSGWYSQTRGSLDDVAEAEERRLRETHEIVRRTNNRPHLHPIDPETGHPYCVEVYTNRKRMDWKTVDTTAVPVGYYPVCTVCAFFWREGQ